MYWTALLPRFQADEIAGNIEAGQSSIGLSLAETERITTFLSPILTSVPPYDFIGVT